MKMQLVLRNEKNIAAATEEVWNVISNPRFFNDWMLVRPQIPTDENLGPGTRLFWVNDRNEVYLTGTVLEFVPNRCLVIGLTDSHWENDIPQNSVTYEFHLTGTKTGTLLRFYFGDLSADAEGASWYKTYAENDELDAIEKLVQSLRNRK